jgi:hypothetical protein
VEASDGWEFRFAQKFRLICAALKLGVDSGLLRWPKSFSLKVATEFYRRARQAANSKKPARLKAAQVCGPKHKSY